MKTTLTWLLRKENTGKFFFTFNYWAVIYTVEQTVVAC